MFVQAIVVPAGGAVAGLKELLGFLLKGGDDKEFVLVLPASSGAEDWCVRALMQKEPTVRPSTSSRNYRVHVSRQ